MLPFGRPAKQKSVVFSSRQGLVAICSGHDNATNQNAQRQWSSYRRPFGCDLPSATRAFAVPRWSVLFVTVIVRADIQPPRETPTSSLYVDYKRKKKLVLSLTELVTFYSLRKTRGE